MDFNDYQSKTAITAKYPDKGRLGGLVYTVLGLAGEAGEIANKTKKILRDDDCILKDEVRKKLSDELGDVLWYLSQSATELGLNLEDIAKANIEKLLGRLERGTLCGSGDNR